MSLVASEVEAQASRSLLIISSQLTIRRFMCSTLAWVVARTAEETTTGRVSMKLHEPLAKKFLCSCDRTPKTVATVIHDNKGINKANETCQLLNNVDKDHGTTL